MDKKLFKIEERKITSFLVTLFLVWLVICFICMKVFDDFEENIFRYLLIAAIIGFVCGIIAFFVAKDLYFQILDDGFEIIHGNNAEKYNYSDFVGSNVVKHYTNGIPSGTTREIRIKRPNSAEIKYEVNHLSEKQFAELVRYLKKNESDQTREEKTPSEVFYDKMSFDVPAKAILKANERTFFSYLILAILCAVIGTVCLVIDSSDIVLDMIGAFGIAGAIALAILAIFPWGKVYLNVRTIPSKISIDSFAIYIDDQRFKPGYISEVQMIPPTYTILTRSLIITSKDGEKYKYNFGKLREREKANQKYTYKDYKDVYAAITAWCDVQKVKYTDILG